MIDVPEAFAEATVHREGESGRAWLRRLPRLVRELCAAWELEQDGPPMHGGLAVVLPVRQKGEPGALKVSWIDEETADEAAALAAWGGKGAVRAYADDPARGALLLERLDPDRSLDDVPIDEAVQTAARLLRTLAIPQEGDAAGVRTRLPDWAEQQRGTLRERQRALGDPLPARAVESALAYADMLGPSSASMLVNRDLHYQNVLAGTREPWLLIDPKPLLGDPEFALAPLLWRRTGEPPGDVNLEVAARRLERLVELAGLDADRARGWTLVRCVDYGLWAYGMGLTWDAAICRALAGWLADGA